MRFGSSPSFARLGYLCIGNDAETEDIVRLNAVAAGYQKETGFLRATENF